MRCIPAPSAHVRQRHRCNSPAAASAQGHNARPSRMPTTHTQQYRNHPRSASAAALLWCLATAFEPTQQPAGSTDKTEKRTLNISYKEKNLCLFPICSQNVPTLFPKLLGALSAAFTRATGFYDFQNPVFPRSQEKSTPDSIRLRPCHPCHACAGRKSRLNGRLVAGAGTP